MKKKYCPVCHDEKKFSSNFDTKSIRAQEYFQIGECSVCKIQAVLNPPTNIDKYYIDTHMKKELNPIHSFLKNILLKKEFNRFRKYLQTKSQLVDIGCGVGDFSKLVFDQGFKPIAVDATDQRPLNIYNLKEIPYHSIDYSTYKIKNLDKINNGTVILRHVLEHTKNPNLFIKKLVSLGITKFYIVVPNHNCLQSKLFKKNYYFLDPPLHLWFFTQPSLKKLLSSCQLTVKQEGFDTIPNIISSLHRYFLIKGLPEELAQFLKPQGLINSLSLPFDWLLPKNVLWIYAELEKN